MESSAAPAPAPVRRLSDTLRQEVLPILGRLPNYGRLVYNLATDKSLSPQDRAILYLALGYQFAPIDLFPGFIPVIGQLDDLLLLLWAVRRTLHVLAPEHAAAILASAHLTRRQLDADTQTVIRALGELMHRGMSAARRGLILAARAALMAGAFTGLFLYYVIKNLRRAPVRSIT